MAKLAHINIPMAELNSRPTTLFTKKKKKIMWKSFTSGAVAAMAGGVATHPIDVIKVRQQIFNSTATIKLWVANNRSLSFASAASNVIVKEGFSGLYRGVTAGLLRQTSFVGTKFLLYEQCKQFCISQDPRHEDEKSLSFLKLLACGCFSGMGGAIVGNPFDLAMVRMQADGQLQAANRRNYQHGFDAVLRITREEGVATLWRGCEATIARGSIITASQFAVYDQSKYELLRHGLLEEGVCLSIIASIISSVTSGICANPFDIAKSRLFQMQRTDNGQWPYKGMLDCIYQTGKQEGVSALWRGLGASVVRQLPLNAIRFLVMEGMTKLLKN
jgi:solute carrier family 25 (mitochondrial oxoglutarate transporter), member 11